MNIISISSDDYESLLNGDLMLETTNKAPVFIQVAHCENKWIPINKDHLPSSGEEVLITFTEDWSYGKGTDVHMHVITATYNSCGGCLNNPEGIPGGFDTDDDWDEGQPIKILAWMPFPKPYGKQTIYEVYNSMSNAKKKRICHKVGEILEEKNISVNSALNSVSRDVRLSDEEKKIELFILKEAGKECKSKLIP